MHIPAFEKDGSVLTSPKEGTAIAVLIALHRREPKGPFVCQRLEFKDWSVVKLSVNKTCSAKALWGTKYEKNKPINNIPSMVIGLILDQS